MKRKSKLFLSLAMTLFCVSAGTAKVQHQKFNINTTPILTNETRSIHTYTISERVKNVIIYRLALPWDYYQLDASFKDNYFADELTMIELVMDLEEEFEIEIPDEEAELFLTPRRVLDYILSQV